MKHLGKILVFLLAVMILTACGSSSSKEEEPVYEFTTKGGINCKVYEGCTISELTAVTKAIKAKVDGSDCDKIYSKDCIVERYEDGMISLSFSPVIVNDYEYGGECYFEFKDEKEEKFSVHYLKVGPEEYINDGIDLEEKYGYDGEE